MGIEAEIAGLEELVSVDAKIKVLNEKLGAERGDIDGVREEVADLESRIQVDTEAATEMDKTRKDLIQEQRQIEKQIERSRDRLGRSRNEREVNAAEREQDELRKLRRDRDDEIKKLAELLDQARVTIKSNQERHDELSARFEGSIEGATKTITELEGQLAEFGEVRQTVLGSGRVIGLTARRYEAMHGRGKAPVAKSDDGTCDGCFVKLPPMLFHRMLSRTSFEECPTCHRIIYYCRKSEDEEEPAAEASAETGSAEAETAAGADS